MLFSVRECPSDLVDENDSGDLESGGPLSSEERLRSVMLGNAAISGRMPHLLGRYVAMDGCQHFID